MAENSTPLVPATYDVVWAVVVLALLVLVVGAIVSIVRHAQALTTIAFVLWLAVVVLLPLIGSALWFVSGRPAARGGEGSASVAVASRPAQLDDRAVR